MRRISDVSGASLVPFVCDVAEKGSEILTDGWGDCNTLSKCGYKHDKVFLSDTGDPAHVQHARRAPNCRLSQTLAIEHTPGIRQPKVSWVLPR